MAHHLLSSIMLLFIIFQGKFLKFRRDFFSEVNLKISSMVASYVSAMLLGIQIAFEDLGFDIYWALISLGFYHRKDNPDKSCFWKLLFFKRREAITSGSGVDRNIFGL